MSEEREQKHCIYVDDNRSFADGYWCKLIDHHIDWCDSRDLCKWPSGSTRCPFCNGEPILTEEIADKIYDAFQRTVDNTVNGLDIMVFEMTKIANQTSMESIEHVCELLRSYCMSLPNARGIYHNHLKLRSEEKVASDLEGKLNQCMEKLNHIMVTLRGLSGEPIAGIEDFNRLTRCIDSYGRQAEERMENYSAGLSGKEGVYEQPARELAVQCSHEVANMVQYVHSDAVEAEHRFSSALRSAESAAQGGVGSVLSNASFNWEFNDEGW